MMEPIAAPPAIACTLSAGDLRQRRAWIAALNSTALLSEHRDDLRLELRYDATARMQVLEMVRNEQICCAFLNFEIHDEGHAIRVVVEAPENARNAAAVLEFFRSKAPGQANGSCCGAAP